MASWGTIESSIPISLGDPVSNYAALDESDPQLLSYSASAGITIPIGNTADNYKLAFSASAPVTRPTTGQIWPRGAGNIF